MNQRTVKALFVWCAGFLSHVQAAQFYVSTNAGDVFRSIGIDTSGTMWIAGERQGAATLFGYTGGSLSADPLGALDPGGAYAYSISRDARSVVGVSGNQAVLWNVSNPSSPLGLGYPTGSSYTEAHSVSSGSTPTVVGFAAGGTGAFLWNSASGNLSFGNPLGHYQTGLTGISADGSVIIGVASSVASSVDPFVYRNGSFTFLDEGGGNVGNALTLSPSGNIIGGEIDGNGAIWNNGTPLRLTLGGSPVGEVLGLTDNGFAVGTAAAGGYIYDPRTGITSLFDDWWLNETGSAVAQHVTGVNDVCAYDGMLSFALETAVGGALASTVVLMPPTLSLTQLGSGEIELRWPTNRAGTVEYTLQLPAQNWTPLTNAVPVLNSNQFTLTLPVTNAAAYFRLRIP